MDWIGTASEYQDTEPLRTHRSFGAAVEYIFPSAAAIHSVIPNHAEHDHAAEEQACEECAGPDLDFTIRHDDMTETRWRWSIDDGEISRIFR